ncbi:PAS domain-containing protein [Amphritea sp. 2_MG-2023]|uniref:PAS domain-containing protein n=1 Tax=Amphritea TaxID=515417 RepID=UPI001C06F2A9|nr:MULTISPECIES: PAS domain-containing protein [Amphritea]MBU2964484.1 PAS domain-containing protein [Amphritea atlantica]MDO6417812.1 PAS domain-containing protein [Amphritea sp. 2_MG-2023]
MSEQDTGEMRTVEIAYFDGTKRTAAIVDREVPYPDGKLIVSRTDPQGVITHANQAFIDMSGYCESELIGAKHYILRHPDMPAVAFKDLWDTIGRGEKWNGYVKNLCKDGSYYWVKATVIPNIRNGQLVGYTSVRRKPSRRKIEESEVLYKTLLAEE